MLESITVFFNDKEAIVKSVSDNEIIVEVPAPGEICEISVLIGDNSLLYETKFNYRKSWSLSTLTGNGNLRLKREPSEGQTKARYLAIDDNNNISQIIEIVEMTSYILLRLTKKKIQSFH